MATLDELRRMTLPQLKALRKEDIHAILQKDDGNDFRKLQEGINEIKTKLEDEVITKIAGIPKMRQEIDELRDTVNKQAAVIGQQQRFLEELDAKDRSHNMVITGVSEDRDLEGASTDQAKTEVVLRKLGSQGLQVQAKRLGKATPGRSRPILVTLSSNTDRAALLGATKNLKTAGEAFKSIYVKKDVHPAVRKEWKRLYDAKTNEENKPENEGTNITLDARKRVLLRDGVVIDRWRPSFFL